MSWLFVWEDQCRAAKSSFVLYLLIIIERETRQDVQHQGLASSSSRAWMQAEHRSGEGLCCLRMKGRRAERRGGLLTCLFSPQLHRTSLRGGTMGAISLRGGTVGRTVCLSGKDSCHLRHINK